jgi:hypothetical protein
MCVVCNKLVEYNLSVSRTQKFICYRLQTESYRKFCSAVILSFYIIQIITSIKFYIRGRSIMSPKFSSVFLPLHRFERLACFLHEIKNGNIYSPVAWCSYDFSTSSRRWTALRYKHEYVHAARWSSKSASLFKKGKQACKHNMNIIFAWWTAWLMYKAILFAVYTVIRYSIQTATNWRAVDSPKLENILRCGAEINTWRRKSPKIWNEHDSLLS